MNVTSSSSSFSSPETWAAGYLVINNRLHVPFYHQLFVHKEERQPVFDFGYRIKRPNEWVGKTRVKLKQRIKARKELQHPTSKSILKFPLLKSCMNFAWRRREREREIPFLSFLSFNFLVILVGGSWWLSQKRVCFTLDLWFHFQGKRKGILIESQTWADSLFLDLCLRSSWAECCSSSLSLIYKFVKKKKKFVFVSDLKWETTRF